MAAKCRPWGWLAALLLVLIPACDRNGEPAIEPANGAGDPHPPQTDGRKTRRLPGADYDPMPALQPTAKGLRFIAYNVENWLTMDRTETRPDGKRVKIPGAPKADSEKQAAARLLARNQPDVVGISEIGTKQDLADFQATLRKAGLDLPHAHHAGGADGVRFLGLVSRFPITSTGDPGPLAYQQMGTTYRMSRGILDATVQARGKDYRFLGVHLKSQRPIPDGDQAEMRLAEAHLLRKHVDGIIAGHPSSRLVVYGDFNETWGTPPIRAIIGNRDTPGYLTAIRASDRMGAYWTHYWKIHDSYSRLDFITVSAALRRETDFQSCRLIDDPEWVDASDHRPIMAVFR